MAAGDVKLIYGDKIQGSKKSVVLDGTDDYVALAGIGAVNCTSGAITAWVNIVDLTATYCVFSVGDTDAESYLSLEIVAGKPRFRYMNATALKMSLIATTAQITTAGWHHIAVVQDSIKPALYLDGVLCTLTNTDTTDTTLWMAGVAGFDNASIGILSMNSTTTLDFNGAIADVKFFIGYLTDTQIMEEFKGIGITNSYTEGSGKGKQTGLLAWWDFNGDYLDDITGAGTYAGTATGGAYLDLQYSELTKQLNAAWVAAGDVWDMTYANGQLVVLHVEGV